MRMQVATCIYIKFGEANYTYSGAVFGAVDEETRSLDSFFFGVFVAIVVKALKFTFLQGKLQNLFKFCRHIVFGICCLGYQCLGNFTFQRHFSNETFSRGKKCRY